MELTMQERNERVARWVGFEIVSDSLYKWPNSGTTTFLPNFPEDIKAFFRWIWPKLDCQSPRLHHIGFGYDGESWVAYLNFEGQKAIVTASETIGNAVTPALALFEAVEQVISQEEAKG